MITVKTRLLYGAGGAVAAAKEAAYTMFILLFYTQVLGLSGTITGLIIAISLVWDGVSDPLVGSLSDRLRSRFGRRHPFMALSILPLGLGFVGLFAPPQAVIDNSIWLAAWLLFWSLWVRTFVTTFTIPHLALSAEITTDYHDRTQVLGARMGLMFLFAVLLPAAALVLVFPEQNGIDGRFEQSRYPLYGMLSCAVVWVMATLSTVGTRHHIRPEVPRPGGDQGERTTLFALVRDLWRTLGNRNFRLLIAYDVAATSAYGVISSLNMLVWTFFWEFSATQISIILSVPTLLAVLLAAVTLGPLGRRLSKQRLVQLSLLGLILNCLWLYPLQLFQLLPADSDRLIFALNFIFMLIFMYLFMLRIINSTSRRGPDRRTRTGPRCAPGSRLLLNDQLCQQAGDRGRPPVRRPGAGYHWPGNRDAPWRGAPRDPARTRLCAGARCHPGPAGCPLDHFPHPHQPGTGGGGAGKTRRPARTGRVNLEWLPAGPGPSGPGCPDPGPGSKCPAQALQATP